MIDKILEPEEVSRITGHESSVRQRNFLKKHGIKHVVNAKKEVILTWAWLNGQDMKVNIDAEKPDFRALIDEQKKKQQR